MLTSIDVKFILDSARLGLFMQLGKYCYEVVLWLFLTLLS